MKRRTRIVLIVSAFLLVAVIAACFGLEWWFERGPGFRRQWDRLAALTAMRPGMTVADLGAGSGRIAFEIAPRVGPAGRLYATEISEDSLAEIKGGAAALGLENITPVRASSDATGLEAGCCDVIYLRRVYHHLTDPQAIARGLYSSLRPGGRLVVIDMLTPTWLPHSLQHGIASEAVRQGIESAGFRLERKIEWWSPIDYCLIFRKDGPRD
jgi:ubiquinone/menaquinone biosynthesis C-methylase UbiE